MNDELPRRFWEVSAPESQVLLWGPETGDAWALKMSIMELVVRRVLRLVTVPDRRLFIFSKHTHVLIPQGRLDRTASLALWAVLEAFPSPRTYRDGTSGVPVDQVAAAVFRRYLTGGSTLATTPAWSWPGGGYVKALVLPLLGQRGLFWQERSQLPVHLENPRWVLTPAGTAALEELRQITAIFRGPFAAWVESDPARARTFVEMAGPALLLMGGLGPLLQRLGQRSGDGGDVESFPTRDRQGFGAYPFGAVAISGAFGPGPADGLDAASYTIAEDVDRAWQAVFGGSGE